METDTDPTADPAAASDAASRRGRWLSPWVLITAMLAVALWLNVPRLVDSGHAQVTPQIPVLLLVACFLVFELVILHVPLGRDLDNAEEFNVTEVVVAVGLLMATPRDFILATTGAAVVINLIRRTQSPQKQIFNGVSRFLDAAVALTVYQALAPADPLSTAGWGAATAAVVASALTSSGCVTLVLVLVVGRISARDVAWSILSAIPLATACGALGFVAVVGLHSEGADVGPVLVAFASLLVVMRSTTVLTERHLSLVSLHAFGEEVAAAQDPESLVALSLDTAAHVLVTRDAVAYLVPPVGSSAERFTRGPDGAVLTEQVPRTEVPVVRGFVRGNGMLVSTASLGDEGEVVLAVSGRSTGMGRLRREDARVLDLVTHRTGSKLQTLLLIERLRYDALHDPLTGLQNRRALVDSARSHAHHGDIVATWLGLAGLQMVNAALGHDLGDELIVHVGERLVRSCGPGGEVSRIGGDEFVVLQPLEASASPLDMARSLLAALAQPFLLSQAPVLLRASAGVAVLRAEATATGDDLLRRADIAMRVAQRTGRAVEIYHPGMETATPDLLVLATELQVGIAAGELVLHGQPQIRLADGVTTGVEMLVRWNHPRRGLLPPSEFLPLAESTGLERLLTDWVLEAATATLADWCRQDLGLTISVNVPASSLSDTHVVQRVQDLLALHGVPGDLLVVEVVESGLIASPDMAAEVLQGISDLGVRVSIDDFGTGFSSLSHLRHLPVDEIKVDRSFVTTMLTDEDNAAIVRSVVTMGRNLGLAVVAEGVEEQEVYDTLRDLGCSFAQGYHMARPMPLDDLAAMLRLGRRSAATSDV